MKRKILVVILSIFIMTGCQSNELDTTVEGISYEVTDKVTNHVRLVIDDEVILIELYENEAPITVENFKNLVKEDYYDGLEFHRIIKDFMVQGGIGEYKEPIKGEFSSNGIENNIKHDKGILSMARTNEPNSASTQFFICLTKEGTTHLDGDYAAFGKVIANMDKVEEIGSTPTKEGDAPLYKTLIDSIDFIIIDEGK